MRYVAAALLAALGGGEPSAANIKKILRLGLQVRKSRIFTDWCAFLETIFIDCLIYYDDANG